LAAVLAIANLLPESFECADAPFADLASGAAFSCSILSISVVLLRRFSPIYDRWIALAPNRLSSRNCSALNECPHVLHRQFAFDLTEFPAAGLNRPFSLGRNAITNSPPHSMHARFAISTLLPQPDRLRRILLEKHPARAPQLEALGKDGPSRIFLGCNIPKNSILRGISN
jgi:hypothetical protein